MGCDIHIYIEYKVGDAPWVHDEIHVVETDNGYTHVNDHPNGGRDYQLFAKLAAVRGEGPRPKGTPKDVSDRVKLAVRCWDGDGHSHSYHSLKTFEAKVKSCGHYGKAAAASGYCDYVDLIAHCHEQVKKRHLDAEIEKLLLGPNINTEVKCRLVYFFDN